MDPFRITSKKVLTLVMVLDKDQQKILLGYKKRGFGAHLWNGFGGKVEPGETPSQGALRELEEEAGITAKPESFKKAGLLLFLFENDPVGLETHVYTAESYEGQIQECDEMRPQWFDFADIPFDQMWEDDKIWLPALLKGQDPFFGRIYLKRKPLEESAPESSTATTTTTTSSTTLEATANVSKTMTGTSFTAAQPKNGPFAMFDQHLEISLPAPPKEINLDGNIASFES
ncbi:NUDIX hydrolase domain-like protein [Mortierella sp. GBAus27b]|nr:Nudix (Nucleoside diphosphate linked moiety X)-type motif 1 [Mortierella sp. GBA43]KAI8347037.1 NUDIX hydrolase domain-like protein [Mortierella sp. GBAus27b]